MEIGYDTNPSGECVAGRKRRCSGGRNERDPGRVPAGAAGRKTENDYEREAKLCGTGKEIDFTALAGRLGQLTEADNPQPKTVFTLLDKVREQIVAARRNRNVSYQVLAKELTSAGIPVSEPTLRKYLRAQGAEKKPRHKAAPKTGNGDGKPAAPVASAETKPATPTRHAPFQSQRVTGKSRRHAQARSCHAACESRQASRQQRACFVQIKVSLSVPASASLSGRRRNEVESGCRLPGRSRTWHRQNACGRRWRKGNKRRAAFAAHGQRSSSASWLASLYPAMLVIKVVCRWPLPPFQPASSPP